MVARLLIIIMVFVGYSCVCYEITIFSVCSTDRLWESRNSRPGNFVRNIYNLDYAKCNEFVRNVRTIFISFFTERNEQNI